jgi:large subunit ribosomal protein L17
MHRHGYQGRKLQREAAPRKALIRGQVTSLVLYEAINTTEAKAKEIAPFFERMVTKAKLGTLASHRSLRAFLLTEDAVQKMIQELAPAFAERNGGYTRIVKTGFRHGDNAPMASVSLVLPEKVAAKTAAKATKSETPAAADAEPKADPKPKRTAKKAAAKEEAKA